MAGVRMTLPPAVRPVTALAARRRLARLGGDPPAESDLSRLVRPVAALSGVAVLVIGGSWLSVPLAVATAVGVDRSLRRIEPPSVRRRRLRAAADLPLAADLLAAALRAGAPVDQAMVAVADALAGPLGSRLSRVARALRLGAEPAEAWRHLDAVPGGERLAAAAIRSAASGAALAGAATRLADDLRAGRSAAAEAAARRAGVLIVLPLGLCFLPAFILAGLVPVIVAVLGDVL
ncbi:type II secretion system F family protein [Solwaraspora sp. WMMA2080]|uniref:type II secretion system F family protein n=1 Tax=unclassified Solwaraspora TaxID=2627926 RepID=UPI00248AE861|nr:MULTISPECIES: type II secretion system F family protein [unclassified Solwaraspora]WBB96554.1 type II secretion system F family protein [Solwaraspora sp. WMMA2059]WBC19541.1 type II secretion system F family protein [Solwaraspora sp. WMMA2080]